MTAVHWCPVTATCTSPSLPLRSELAKLGVDATLDGERVLLGEGGKPQFYELMRHRSRACFVAFDILELAGRDVRWLPLVDRKRILHRTIHSRGRVLVPDHVEGVGVSFFNEVCRRDLEGIVAKWKYGRYVTGDKQPIDRTLRRHARNPQTASRLTWIKVKNPAYSQSEGRGDLFGAPQ